MSLDDEGRGFLIADTGEGDHHIGKARVRDPLLGAIEDVILAILRKLCARGQPHGVGPHAGLGQGIGGDPFASGQLWQVFPFLLFVAIEDDRQGPNGSVGAKGHAK